MNSEKPKSGLSKTIKRLILVVSIGLALHILFLLFTVDKASFALLKNIHLGSLLLICFLAICPWLGHSIRVVMWSAFIKHPMTFREIFPIVIVNDLGAALTPTALGGGPVKLALLVQKGMPPHKATFLVVLSAVEDIFFYTIGIILSAFYLKSTLVAIATSLAANNALLVFLIFLLSFPFLFKKLNRRIWKFIFNKLPDNWKDGLRRIRLKFAEYFTDMGLTFMSILKEGKSRLAISIVILFFQWITKFTILAVLLTSLNIDFSWFNMYIKQWLIYVSMLIIPTPGASGGSEAAFLYLFNKDIGGDLSNLIVSTWRFFTYYFVLIISVLTLNLFNKSLLK